jgi:dienelactone hydrolase
VAQAWYPVDAKAAQTTRVYAPQDPEITHATGWSQPGAPFSARLGKAPVVALCTGRGMPRYFYTAVAEDLASHGYVVLGVDLPHLGLVRYPDGRVIPPIEPSSEARGSYAAFDDFWEKNTGPGSADVRFALESLEKIGAGDPARRLTGKLDWTRLGAVGHSLGTRTCGGAVLGDPRFAAFAVMDGPLPRDARKRGVDAALLFMMSASTPKDAEPSIRESVSSRRNDVHLLRLDSFAHLSFTDLPFLEPGKHPGKVDPLAGLERTREILRTFFDQYVKKTGPGVSSLSKLPEARLESFPKPGK